MDLQDRIFAVAALIGPAQHMITNVGAVNEAIARAEVLPSEAFLRRNVDNFKSDNPSAISMAVVTKAALQIRPDVVQAMKAAEREAKGL